MRRCRRPRPCTKSRGAFVVVEDAATLKRLSDRAKGTLMREAKHYRDLHAIGDPEMSRAFVERLASPGFSIFYDAPTLIVICAKPKGPFVNADCWLAAENLMLAYDRSPRVVDCLVRTVQRYFYDLPGLFVARRRNAAGRDRVLRVSTRSRENGRRALMHRSGRLPQDESGHRQSRIAGISSPCRRMYSRCSIRRSASACLT